MTDPTPPGTLRDELAGIIRDARREVKRIHSIAPTSLTDADFDAADRLLASFDIRPHNEPAGVRVPDGMTAEKLCDLAQLLEDLGLTLGLVPEKAEWLREWADEIAARDVGGDFPAGMEKP